MKQSKTVHINFPDPNKEEKCLLLHCAMHLLLLSFKTSIQINEKRRYFNMRNSSVISHYQVCLIQSTFHDPFCTLFHERVWRYPEQTYWKLNINIEGNAHSVANYIDISGFNLLHFLVKDELSFSSVSVLQRSGRGFSLFSNVLYCVYSDIWFWTSGNI